MHDVGADVKQMPNKDGGGKGQMAAWKVSRRQSISNDHRGEINIYHLRNNIVIIVVDRRNANNQASYRPARSPKSTKNGVGAMRMSPDPKTNPQRARPSLSLTKRRRRK